MVVTPGPWLYEFYSFSTVTFATQSAKCGHLWGSVRSAKAGISRNERTPQPKATLCITAFWPPDLRNGSSATEAIDPRVLECPLRPAR